MRLRKSFFVFMMVGLANIALADNYTIPSSGPNAGTTVTNDQSDRIATIRSTIGGFPSTGRHTITYTDGISGSFDVTHVAISGVEVEIVPGTQRDSNGNLIGGSPSGGSPDGQANNGNSNGSSSGPWGAGGGGGSGGWT